MFCARGVRQGVVAASQHGASGRMNVVVIPLLTQARIFAECEIAFNPFLRGLHAWIIFGKPGEQHAFVRGVSHASVTTQRACSSRHLFTGASFVRHFTGKTFAVVGGRVHHAAVIGAGLRPHRRVG